MSEGTVRQWCRMFKDGVSDDLGQSVDQRIFERWSFTFSELSCEFPQISGTVLFKIITVRLGCHKFCARWVPKMLMGMHKTQRMDSALMMNFSVKSYV
jgi:hypothetical protein